MTFPVRTASQAEGSRTRLQQSTCCCHARRLAVLTALLALRPLKLTCRLPHSLYPDDRHISLYCFLRILILLVSIREACGCLKEAQSDVEKHRILRGHMVWFNSVSSVVILFSAIDKVGHVGISLEMTKGSD